MSLDVGIASCLTLPEPDPDAAPLATALREAGLSFEVAAWDDEQVEWSRFSCVVLRSTWNYALNRPAFLRWIERVEAVSVLHNGGSVVRWNTHKSYLLELTELGINTVPTELCDAGSETTLASVGERHGWTDVVVKPAVSAGSYLTFRMRCDQLEFEQRFADLVGERDMLVQPFIQSVVDYGERSVVVIDGVITHAIRKSPRFGGEDESIRGPMPIEPRERALAMAALATIKEPLLYARVDMAPSETGDPMITELELTEPSLFFDEGPAALTAFVEGIKRRLTIA